MLFVATMLWKVHSGIKMKVGQSYVLEAFVSWITICRQVGVRD